MARWASEVVVDKSLQGKVLTRPMKLYSICIPAFVLLPICTSQVADSTSTPPPAMSTPAEATEVSPFTAVGDTTKPDSPNSVYYDFGNLSLARTEPIKHVFKLHNNTDAAVTIARVQAACGCTTALPDNGVPGDYKPVDPGKDLTINISIDPGHLYAGAIDKMVWVYLPSQNAPAFTLHVTGTMTAAASFVPAVLNLGTVQAGKSSTQKLTVTMDTSAYGANPPDPISTNTDLKIIRAATAPSTAASSNQVVRNYDVTLSPKAHIGPLQGTIAMPQPNNPGHPGVGPSVFVTGTVVGELSAAPMSVAFGAVNVGKTFTQDIVLTGTTAKALHGLKVKCGSKNLSGAVKSVKAQSAVLEVTFLPAATGSMQSDVTVTTKSGQQLDLPVWAWVNQ